MPAAPRSSESAAAPTVDAGGSARGSSTSASRPLALDVRRRSGRARGACCASAAAIVAARSAAKRPRCPSIAVSRPTSSTPCALQRGEVERRGGRADRRAAATARGGRATGRRHVVDRAVEARRSGRATRRCPCRGSAAACGVWRADGERRRRGRLRRSSSASCTPVADAPTTSTPPSGSVAGSPVVGRGDLVRCAGRQLARQRGTAGRSHQPVAMTTLSARQRAVGRWRRRSRRRRPVDALDGRVLATGRVERARRSRRRSRRPRRRS